MLSFASGSSQPEQFLLIYSSLGYGTGVPTPRIAADSHSPFFIFAFVLAYIPCVDSVFFQKIQITAFTTTSFTWWPGATKLISVAVLPYNLFRLSACPSWVRLCRICLFGFRLVRAGFGYAESAFSVFGLSELGSALPSRRFD